MLISINPYSVVNARHLEQVLQFGTPFHDSPSDLAVDSDSTLFTIGSTTGSFGNETNIGSLDAFILKTDSEGNEIWTRQFGTADDDFGNAIAVDTASSEFYAAGSTFGTFENASNSGDQDLFVAKFDSEGNQMWLRQFGSTERDETTGIVIDGTGIVVSGWTVGSLSNQTHIGSRDVFVAKFDSDGTEEWLRQFGTEEFDSGGAIDVHGGHIFVLGDTEGAFANQTNSGFVDSFLSKFDGDGNEIWTVEFGTDDSEHSSRLEVDSSGIYVVGETFGVFEEQESAGDLDGYVIKFDADGDQLWTNQFGTEGDDSAAGLSLDDDSDAVFVAGSTDGTFDGELNEGFNDAFISKFDKEQGDNVWNRQLGTTEDDFGVDNVIDGDAIHLLGGTVGNFAGDEQPSESLDIFLATMGTDDALPPDTKKPTVEFESAEDEDGDTIPPFSSTFSRTIEFAFTVDDNVEVDHADCYLISDSATNNIESCASPVTFEDLPPSGYVFAVNVTDTSGNFQYKELISFTIVSDLLSIPPGSSSTIEQGAILFVKNGQTLDLGANSTLSNQGILVNDGTIRIGANATLINSGTINNNFGAEIISNGTIVVKCNSILNNQGVLSPADGFELEDCASAAEIQGTQYEDIDADGTRSSESGIEGVRVHAFTFNGITEIETIEQPWAIAANPYTNLIYVSDRDNKVSVINGTTFELITSVEVGPDPIVIAVNPQTNLIYSGILYNQVVSVIDGQSNEEVDRISLFTQPVGISIDPSTNRIYVIGESFDFANELTIIDGSTHEIIETVTLENVPGSIDLNPNTNRVFVSNFLQNGISVFDSTTFELVDTIELGAPVRSIVVDPVTNTLYGTGESSNTVYVADLDTKLVKATIGLKGDPGDAKLDASTGLLYVAENKHGIVAVIDTKSSSLVAEIDTGLAPNQMRLGINSASDEVFVTTRGSFDIEGEPDIEGGMAVLKGMRLYSASTEGGGNYKLENLGSGAYTVSEAPPILHPSTFVLTTYEGIEELDGTSYPAKVAVNTNSHRVYVTEPFSNELLIYNGESGELDATIPVPFPSSIAVNQANGLIYVSNFDEKSISILDDSAGEAVPVTNVQLNHTVANLAINPANNKLYITSPEEHLITIMNTEDNSIIAELEVGDFPMSMIIDPLTNTVYVADGLLFSIHVIDGNEDVLLESIPIELSAGGPMGFDPSSGLLYLALFDKVVILDVESGATVGSITTGGASNAVIFDASTGLVLATEAGKIVVIDGRPDSDTFGLRLGQIKTGNAPFDLAVDPSLNKVYILDTGFYPDVQGSLLALSGLAVEEISNTDNLPSDNFSIIGTSPIFFATTQPPQGSYSLELGDSDEIDGIDFGNADPDSVGILTVDARYFDSTPANGMPVDIIQDGSVIAQGKTPITFTLKGNEEYTILAHHQDSSFFSAWTDNGFPGISRDFTIHEKEDLHFEALYANIPGTDVVEVNVGSKEVFDNGTEREVTGVRTLIQTGNNIRNALDSGLSPKVFHLADEETYTAIATDSEDFVFDHWVDPETGDPIFSRSLPFTAAPGLTLTSVYNFSNSGVVTIPVKSKLLDGTELNTMFNKVYRHFNETNIVDRGFTPNEYHLEKDDFYTAVASDFRGIVFDHWEANGTGFFQNYTVFSNEIEFYVYPIGGYALEELTAVYRIVDEEDFASIPVDETGQDVEASAPSINGGVDMSFNVVSEGNVTLAVIPVLEDSNLFESISESEGTANITIPNPEGEGFRTYVTTGPVIRVNTATLTLEGDREVTIQYDPSSLPPDELPRLLHFNGLEWEDITTSVDEESHTVTGRAPLLSPLVASHISTDSKFGVGGIRGVTIGIESGGDITATSEEISNVGTVALTFDNVTEAGNVDLTVKASSELKNTLKTVLPSGGTMEVDSKIQLIVGKIIEVDSSDISFTGKVRVTIPYDPDMLPDGASESDIRLLHLKGSDWEDETVDVDSGSNTVTGELSSFSPVVAGIEVPEDEDDGGEDNGSGNNGGGSGGGSGGSGGGSSGGNSQSTNQSLPKTLVYSGKEAVAVGNNVDIMIKINQTSGVVRVGLENVASPGEVEVNLAPISQFADSFDNNTQTNGITTVEDSKFHTFGKIFNITGSASLRFTGDLKFTIPYNTTELLYLQGSMPEEALEDNVRLLQLVGDDSWQDITTKLNNTSNEVGGVSTELGPIVAAIVEDGTFGGKFLDSNPLSNMKITNVTGSVDDGELGISAEVRNLERTSQSYLVVVQIENKLGQAVHIELIEQQTILPGSSVDVSFSWSPEDDRGENSVSVIVLNNLATAQMLSTSYRVTI